jgi:hypothetical protein
MTRPPRTIETIETIDTIGQRENPARKGPSLKEGLQ